MGEGSPRTPGSVSLATLEAFERVARGLRDALDLGDVVASYGDGRSAAEYVVGALRDLTPDLQRLLDALRTPE
jgi:hypothetical protein